jgi:hypothetical protein
MAFQVKSLGYRTDFIFNRLDGSLRDREEYLVATTESNPHYFWGNLLFFKEPPKLGDLARWKEIFRSELSYPQRYHMTFAWDSPTAEPGDCSEFIADGFELETSIVLTARAVQKPRKYNGRVTVRELDLLSELAACVDVQVACATGELSQKSWREFYTTSMKGYRRLIEAGHGKWFGAFLDNKLVGSLGIFKDGTLGRFQVVSTHPEFQRQGVCSTLVYQVSKYALKDRSLSTLVMVADEDYHAAQIYESVGFKPTEKKIGLCWWDREKHR